MKYFRNTTTGAVSGFDDSLPSQLPYIQKAIADGLVEITGDWPPLESYLATKERLSATLTSAINDGAKQWGYDDITSAVSYLISKNEQYAKEAHLLSDWRDAVWAWAIPALTTVPPGTEAGAFLANMPELPPKP